MAGTTLTIQLVEIFDRKNFNKSPKIVNIFLIKKLHHMVIHNTKTL